MSTSLCARRYAGVLSAALVVASCASHSDRRPTAVPFVAPPDVTFTMHAGEEPRVLRVRAYADEEYRARHADWEARIADQVQRAGAHTEDEFGIRLHVESVRAWERSRNPGGLEHALDRLVREDPAFDVDWVVGFIGPLPAGENGHDELGKAHPFGRHFVIRAIDAVGPHRLFLHEWAHTLGAVNDCAGSWIMSPRHGAIGSAFSPESAWLVRLGLRYRALPGASPRREWESAYRAGADGITAAFPGCPPLERDLDRMHDLLRCSSCAYTGAPGRPPQNEFGRWIDAFLGAMTPRVKEVVERVKPLVPGQREGTAERVTLVSISIDRTAAVTDVRVRLSSGFAPFDEGMVEAVRAQLALVPPPPEAAPKDGTAVYTCTIVAELGRRTAP